LPVLGALIIRGKSVSLYVASQSRLSTKEKKYRMSYIEENIAANEQIIKKGSIHRIIYVLPLIYLAYTAVAITSLSFWHFLGLLWLLNSFIVVKTTEFAVTNKKVIAKRGLIARKTVEVNLPKVESLSVDQSILGRLFNYGTVTIRGTGGVNADFRLIADPLALRKVVNEEYEKVEGRG